MKDEALYQTDVRRTLAPEGETCETRLLVRVLSG